MEIKGKNYHGEEVLQGTMVIGPSGQLVRVRPGAAVKPGWRAATAGEIDAAIAAARAAKTDGREGVKAAKPADPPARRRSSHE